MLPLFAAAVLLRLAAPVWAQETEPSEALPPMADATSAQRASLGADVVLDPLLTAAEADLESGRDALALSRAAIVISVVTDGRARVRADGLTRLARQRLGDAPPPEVSVDEALTPLVDTAATDAGAGRTDLARARLDFVIVHVIPTAQIAIRARAFRLAMDALGPADAPQGYRLPQTQAAAPDVEGTLAEVEALHGDERDQEALARLEDLVLTAPSSVFDRAVSQRTRRALYSLDAPGAEPEWFYVGIPLLGAGAVTVLLTWLGDLFVAFGACGSGGGCSPVDPTPFYVGYGVGAGLALTGLINVILGLAQHTFDGERRDFDNRRDRAWQRLRQRIRGARSGSDGRFTAGPQ